MKFKKKEMEVDTGYSIDNPGEIRFRTISG